jgi:hypothetical protein
MLVIIDETPIWVEYELQAAASCPDGLYTKKAGEAAGAPASILIEVPLT